MMNVMNDRDVNEFLFQLYFLNGAGLSLPGLGPYGLTYLSKNLEESDAKWAVHNFSSFFCP